MTWWVLLGIALVAGAAIAWFLTVRRADRAPHWSTPEPYEGEVPQLRLSRFGDAGDVPVGDVVAGAVEVGTGAHAWREAADDEPSPEPGGLAWDDGTASAGEPIVPFAERATDEEPGDEPDGVAWDDGTASAGEPLEGPTADDDGAADDDPAAYGGQPTTPPASLFQRPEGEEHAATRWMRDAPDEDALLATDVTRDHTPDGTSNDAGDGVDEASPGAQDGRPDR